MQKYLRKSVFLVAFEWMFAKIGGINETGTNHALRGGFAMLAWRGLVGNSSRSADSMSADNWQNPILDASSSSQINVPPGRGNALWKVIVSEIRCPNCHSSATKARTGKRRNGQGLSEHYRGCVDCGIRFRVIFE